MTPAFHGTIGELAAELDHCQQLLMDDRRQRHPLAERARTLLAQPVAEGPTDEELEKLAEPFSFVGEHGWARTVDDEVGFARAVLARWGRPAAAPVAMIELITDMAMHLAHMQELLEDYEYGDPEDYHWYRESVRLRGMAAEVQP